MVVQCTDRSKERELSHRWSESRKGQWCDNCSNQRHCNYVVDPGGGNGGSASVVRVIKTRTIRPINVWDSRKWIASMGKWCTYTYTQHNHTCRICLLWTSEQWTVWQILSRHCVWPLSSKCRDLCKVRVGSAYMKGKGESARLDHYTLLMPLVCVAFQCDNHGIIPAQ